MAQKPSIPKGTRDFGPAEMAGRNYIFDTIRSVFKTYGYAPIETPSMENLSTLLGKYGEEGDKLLFRILDSGDFMSRFKEGYEVRDLIYSVERIQNYFAKYKDSKVEDLLLKYMKASKSLSKNVLELIIDALISADVIYCTDCDKLIYKSSLDQIQLRKRFDEELNSVRNQLIKKIVKKIFYFVKR